MSVSDTHILECVLCLQQDCQASASFRFAVMQPVHSTLAHFENVSRLFHVVTDVSEERTAAPPEPASKARNC